MRHTIHQHRLSNGLWLVAEPMAGVESLAMTMLLPAGVASEPADQLGAAALLEEMICRGAGDLDAKAHSDALDRLGVQRGTNVETRHLRLGATMIGQKLPEALPLLMDMVRRPMLAKPALEPARDLALQALDALEDEPQDRVFIDLRQQHYPQPLGRSPLGQRPHLEAIDIKQLRQYWQATFVPQGAVLGFAGRLDWDALRDRVEQLLGDWQGDWPARQVDPSATGPRGYRHESAQTAQVHIGLAYDALPEPHEDSILQRAAVAVLSGGMSGRLFTEVREKRGLCYSVFAAYAGQKDRGAIFSYAGTTTARAQETLDVLTAELRRLTDGVAADEFDRAKVGMKSRLVMQGESTGARASAIAMDQYLLDRPRTLDELAARVEAVTLQRLNAFVAEHPPGAMTIVTIGPDELKLPA